MKKSILHIILFFTCLFVLNEVNGQDVAKAYKKQFEEANYYFSFGNYPVALPMYDELSKAYPYNSLINFNLGVCIYNTKREKTEAIPYFEQSKNYYIDAYFYLAKLYHLKMQFDTAMARLQYYKTYNTGNTFKLEDINKCIDEILTAKDLLAAPVNVTIRNIGESINSPYADYVPVISADEKEMFFTSRRPGSTGGLLDPNNEFFEDVYVSFKMEGKWTSPINVGPPINTDTHDACISLSPDGKILFIYRTDKYLTGGDIYMSEIKNGNWTDPQMLDNVINTKTGLEPSAGLSPDQQVLYFSSDRSGGYGGKDIYRSIKLPDSTWSIAKNLGPIINTPYDEDAPFMHSDGVTLYFSSKGHKNMGGYDIFKSELQNDGTWTLPENMGYPINTVRDDIYFVVSANGERGYYSSNRKDGYGNSDIYVIDMPGSKAEIVFVKGKIAPNNTPETDLKATIILIDLQSEEIYGIYRPNKRTGEYLLILPPYKKFKMIVEANGYRSFFDLIDTNEATSDEFVIKNILLEKN